jgi:exopolysaccharide biosynthesis polyprenyl glycosylphosphotransferase
VSESEMLVEVCAAPPTTMPGHQETTLVAPAEDVRTRRANRFLRSDNRLLMVSLDALALTAAALATDAIYPSPGLAPDRLLLLSVPAFLVALFLNNVYQKGGVHIGVAEPARAILRALSSGVLITLVLAALFGESFGRHVQVVEACLVGAFAIAFIPAARALPRLLPGWRRPTRAVIVGSGKVAESVRGRLGRYGDTEVVGMVDNCPAARQQVLGCLDELPMIVQEHRIEHVIVAFSRTPSEQTLDVLRTLGSSVAVSVVPRMYELLSWRSTVTELHGLPLLNVAAPQRSRTARAAKRVFDLSVSCLMLVLLVPVYAAVSVAIKVGSPGPVLYRQVRTGRHGRPFTIYKFRTMFVDADERRTALAPSNEADGPLFKMRADPRITPVGRILRRTSLDELPQLLNVVKGDMSLVGPRPFLVAEAREIGGFAARRFDVPPGITGLWQVSGRSELTYDDLRFLDALYVSSWSFWWDLRILAQTPRSVFVRRGAF